MDDLFDQYFALRKQVHDYFGYVEDWVTIPLDDCREYFWKVTGEGPGGLLLYHETGEHYENVIYTQRFLPKWVYRAERFTLICQDTRTDGNKFLSIFDNAKEVS